MTYEKQYNWNKLKEQKGWETENLPDDMYKVKINENETNREKARWFNFTADQKKDGRWKKHIDQWIKRVKQVTN